MTSKIEWIPAGIVCVVAIVVSPWFGLLAKRPSDFWPAPSEWYKPTLPTRVAEINFFRGAAGHTLMAKLVANKYSWSIREGFIRMAESFDPHFLFFEGDIDSRRSIPKAGALVWLVVPGWLYALWNIKLRTQIVVVIGLVLLTLPSVVVENHFYSPAKIPMLVAVYLISGWGYVKLWQRIL